MASSAVEAARGAQVALQLACERLLSLQDEAGWWQGELQTNVTMDAEDMLLREFLGIRRADGTERSAAWIRSQQRADGTWANFHGGPGELSTTIEAYWALRLAGDPPEAEHMLAAASFIRSQGGLESARVFTHVWLALFGLWPWERVPALPPEIVLLPPSAPLNIYDFACWARQTIVALSLVKAFRPVRPLAFGLDELRAGEQAPQDAKQATGSAKRAWLSRLDAARRLEACQSPVWDTALAMIALGDAGIAPDHPGMGRAASWLLGEEVTARGDWAVARRHLKPGGWAFEFANVNYPDVDDTAEVVMALARARAEADADRIDAAVARGRAWLEGMQSSDGGWGAFDADNTRALVRELPFLDFGEGIDEPSADVTAHAVEMLAALERREAAATPAAVAWLLDHQERDGSWSGRWGINHVYGTGAVVPALIAARIDPAHESIRRAVRWLAAHQNEDGGWGE